MTYEGDDKVKQAKLQNAKTKYEFLQIEEEDNITSYFQKIDNVVNEIKGLGGNLLEDEVVKKVLRTLNKPYSSKILEIKESQNQNKYTREYLYGSLLAFELREFGTTSARTKIAFNATTSAKDQESNEDKFDETKDKFVRMKKGTGK